MKKVFLTSLLSIFAFFFLAKSTFAKVMVEQNGVITVGANETVNDDLYIGADTVQIDGTVNGDVFAGAKIVRISGKINGNLHVGAQNFIDNGAVNGNLYLGAQSVTLNGAKVSGSMLVGAMTVYIDNTSSIGRSLIVGASDLNDTGPVGRNVIAGAGSVYLDSVVGGEVRLGSGKIKIGPNTKIAKDLYYMTDRTNSSADIAQDASIAGVIKKTEYQYNNQNIQMQRANAGKIFGGFKFGFSFISYLAALVVGFILLKLFPKAAEVLSSQVLNSTFRNLGIGFLLTVLILPVLFVLAITIIGLPLAGLVFALFLISLYLTKIAVGYGLGNWISIRFGWKNMSSYAVFAVGLLVIYLLKMIPVLGFFVSVIVVFVGLGALYSFCKLSLPQAKS